MSIKTTGNWERAFSGFRLSSSSSVIPSEIRSGWLCSIQKNLRSQSTKTLRSKVQKSPGLFVAPSILQAYHHLPIDHPVTKSVRCATKYSTKLAIMSGGVAITNVYGTIPGPLAPENLRFRTSTAEFDQLEEAMRAGDNLPNTMASLGAKLKRRALLVGVQYEADRRFTQSRSALMLSTPSDVLMVYRMLLSCGYEHQNIRILVEGVVEEPLSHPTKKNIIESLEWLFDGTEPGDYRYFHFSGHGYAYEVEEGLGKTAKIKPVVSAPIVYPDSSPLTDSEESNWSTPSRVRFYREALLTEWNYPPLSEMLEMQSEGTIRLDPYTRISDEELNAMIAKLPKGCVLTMTLNCFHGAQMHNVNYTPKGPIYRGGVGWPIDKLEEDRPTMNPFQIYPSTSLRNLFIPPVFYLHSEFRYDPKVMMERIQGPGPLDGVQATVFVWSGYTTARTHARVFMSAFSSVVQDLKGYISHRGLFQEISRKVGEGSDEDDHPLIQLWTAGGEKDEKAEVPMSERFVI
ncbi:hypothetical protein RSOLAG22IIIB_12247 [Rhizoctonia solani]|uniref:Peptidase C14 caspase domain-containing protein n=1 Tax=Rhizoctonia solani TaxID=456999 RepID=A0A0K6GCM6_9AGAM|nr:hypothetical protein RSOLAG22IIIB_12247 [Rhizoctonia solani]